MGARLQLMAVGKTGSSTLEETLEACHTAFGRVQALTHEHDQSMRALRDCDSATSLILSVRAPITRLLSAWRENRFQEGRAGFRFNDNDELFRTPNELGCALGSDNEGLAAAAEASMLHTYHIRNNLASYLVSPQFLRDSASGRIFHVLRAEHLGNDLAELIARLWPANASLAPSADAKAVALRAGGKRKAACPGGEGRQASPSATSTIMHRASISQPKPRWRGGPQVRFAQSLRLRPISAAPTGRAGLRADRLPCGLRLRAGELRPRGARDRPSPGA